MLELYLKQALISFPFYLLFYGLFLYFLDIIAGRWQKITILGLLAFAIVNLSNGIFVVTQISYLGHIIGFIVLSVLHWKYLKIRLDYAAYAAFGVLFMSYWLTGFILLILAVMTSP